MGNLCLLNKLKALTSNKWLYVFFMFGACTTQIYADVNNIPIETESSINTFVLENESGFNFYGLASYYNDLNYYVIDNDELQRIDEGEVIKLSQAQWLAVVGRFNVLLIQAKELAIQLDNSTLMFDNPEILNQSNAFIKIVTKAELFTVAPELDQIRYQHLWVPLAWLANMVESSLEAIQIHIVSNWGLVIIVFAVLLKLVLLPVGVMTTRFQRKVSQVQAQLAPQLADIKANFDGEEAHNRLMAAHKNLSVSPFYTLKPLLGSFIQIPILIAVFNALGEMPQLDGQSFLWIKNLAYPDAIIAHFSFNIAIFGYTITLLPFDIPMFGTTINLLPFLMTVITLFATVIFRNRHAPEAEIKRQKRNLYFMAIVFFVLFYPFPAAMVLYWTLANILQTIQQQVIKI